MHRLLKRQLDRHIQGGAAQVPAEYQAFIGAVDSAYQQFDDDRAMLERSLELSSEELLHTNSELRTVVQAFPDVFLRVDRAGVILERKGGDDDDPYFRHDPRPEGRRIQDVLVTAVGEKFATSLAIVHDGKRPVSLEYALEINGETRHFEARLLPLIHEQVMVIVRNITDRKKAEQALFLKARELERSNAELEQFAYVASHDLQEPLRTVQSYLQLLARRYGNKLDPDADEFIQFAVQGAQRMRQLIADLLTYSRVSSRAQPPVEVAIDSVVDEVLGGLKAALDDCSGEVTRDALPTVKADRGQLKQLYQNLIANALKFTRERRPRVHLLAERDGTCWRLAVRDNGIGMNPEYAEKIFEIFKRLHSKDEYEGTGIGLAICKKIVLRHGGKLWVDTELGKGSTFWFTLPMNAVGP